MADIIDELKGLSDAELAKKLGFADKVDQFKKDMVTAAALSGEARARVVTRLTTIFTPETYEFSGLHHTIERAANPKEKECKDFVNSCGCTDYID